ncbi:HK97 gp10 family phage protein [Virgibacillus sp. FSP13]
MSGAVDKIRRKKAALYALAENFAGHMESYAKQNASWVDRTGHARQSIHGGVEESGDEVTIYLSHGVQYGRYLEEGTSPHIIRPKTKQALYWYGANHPVKEVHHPGTRAQPIIGPTVDTFWPRIKKARRELFRED